MDAAQTPPGDTLSPAEVAVQLGVSERYVRQLIKTYALPHIDLGRGRIRLTAEQREALLASLTRNRDEPRRPRRQRARRPAA